MIPGMRQERVGGSSPSEKLLRPDPVRQLYSIGDPDVFFWPLTGWCKGG